MKYNLAQYFFETCRRDPDKVALITEAREYTYKNLREESTKLAAFLKAGGVKPGDRVLLAKENGYEMIVSFWAILFCGASVATYSHKNAIEKILFAIENAEPSFLILDDSLVANHRDLIESKRVPFITTGSLVGIAQSTTGIDIDLSTIISEDIAAILYTSGSTGDPKGVTLTHANMTTALLSITTYLGMKESDVIISALPLTFDYGLYQMIMAFAMGATLVLEENVIWPPELLQKADKYAGTILPIVPTMAVAFEAFKASLKMDLSRVRIVTNTAERFKEGNFQTIRDLFPNAKMFSMYGLTECKRCTYVPPDRLDEKKGSVGKAIPNTEIRILDENGRFLPPHQEGELVIRGGTVMRGYWKMKDATARSFHYDELGNKWLRSGDYGYLDEEGFFYLKGRRDAIVKIRGMKVSLLEVEEVLSKSELVQEAGIVVRSEKEGPSQLIAFVTPAKTCTGQDILKYSRDRLQAFEVPSEIRFLDPLPKNLNGKIDRRALAELSLIGRTA
jgi:acyl-CoA synthetase (AMP-forming)/AMP-acid ligase II